MLTRLVFVLIPFFAVTGSHASTSGNVDVELYEYAGDPSLSVVFGTDETGGIWSITMTVNGRQLSEERPVRTIEWAIFDPSLNQMGSLKLHSQFTQPVRLSGTYPLAFRALGSEAADLMRRQQRLALKLILNRGGGASEVVRWVPLATYCSRFAGKFFNLDTFARGCAP